MTSVALSLHIFRRDLRIDDNTALIYALTHARSVIPCFIFDPRQVKEHPYRSVSALNFMIESLKDLAEQLKKRGAKLYFFYGTAEEVIAQLCDTLPIGLVTFNRDYTRFAQERDANLKKVLMHRSIPFYIAADALLNEPEVVHKNNKTPYTIFTPFYKQATTIPVVAPRENTQNNYYTQKIELDQGLTLLSKYAPAQNPHIALHGGTKEGLLLLDKALKLYTYSQRRDYPASQYTSYLSAHHKFGTLSIRRVYHTLKKETHLQTEALIRQLYWRDFFTHIAHHFPHVWRGAFHSKFDQIPFSNDSQKFQKWCIGQTGFPIVDAGIRELNTTGYMHNRVRMITASFLVKDLHIDWRWGERYFAQHLIDYDPAVNNGNWQWAASTGCDAQPYFRIFNPWRQQERFDPECRYIKKWIPELSTFTPLQIHSIPNQKLFHTTYPKPITDHKIASEHAKKIFKNL